MAAAPSTQAPKLIFLVDATGSVITGKFSPTYKVFDKIRDITKEHIKKHGAIEANMLFWNYNVQDNKMFPNGAMVVPFPVKLDQINSTFKMVESHINIQGTYPETAFQNIPPSWIDNVSPTHIYFITDGVMSDPSRESKAQLANCIANLLKGTNFTSFHLIAVEPKIINFDTAEQVSAAAGGDVYGAICAARMTGSLASFVCYTLNHLDGFPLIERTIAPPGFAAFGDHVFPIETGVPDFIKMLSQMVNDPGVTEDRLINIIQKLVATLVPLVKDKSPGIQDSIVGMFSQIFETTSIDPAMARFMIQAGLNAEIGGRASTNADFRVHLKNLFSQANQMLVDDSRAAMGGGASHCMSFPIGDCIVNAPITRMTERVKLGSKGMNRSSISLHDNGIAYLLPVFPIGSAMTPLNRQCLRQYTRAVVSSQYGINAMSDEIIYVVLGLMIRIVCTPDIEPSIKAAWIELGKAMLCKKRLKKDITELDYFKEGNFPTPSNGSKDDFISYMRRVQALFFKKADQNLDMVLWYAMCAALGDAELLSKQKIWYVKDGERVFGDPNIPPQELLNRVFQMTVPIVVVELGGRYEYTCPITLESSAAGGHVIKQHDTIRGSKCSPNQVFSTEGFSALMSQAAPSCPICYTRLTAEQFEQVGPMVDDPIAGSPLSVIETEPWLKYIRPSNQPQPTRDTRATPTSPMSSAIPVKRHAIILKGVVGAGKTTYAQRIQARVEAMGGVCVNESTDKYCKNDDKMQTAVQKVGQAIDRGIQESLKDPNRPLVVIIDTCGDSFNKSTTEFFNRDFAGWKISIVEPNFERNMVDGYLHWSLFNVLSRGMSSPTTPFWLNPDPRGAGLSVCLKVHAKKADAFGIKPSEYNKYINLKAKTREGILEELRPKYLEYQAFLDASKPLEVEIQMIVDEIKRLTGI